MYATTATLHFLALWPPVLFSSRTPFVSPRVATCPHVPLASPPLPIAEPPSPAVSGVLSEWSPSRSSPARTPLFCAVPSVGWSRLPPLRLLQSPHSRLTVEIAATPAAAAAAACNSTVTASALLPVASTLSAWSFVLRFCFSYYSSATIGLSSSLFPFHFKIK